MGSASISPASRRSGRRRRLQPSTTGSRSGFAGEMSYMARTAEKRRDSRLPSEATTQRSSSAMNYGGREPSGPSRDMRAATTITT